MFSSWFSIRSFLFCLSCLYPFSFVLNLNKSHKRLLWSKSLLSFDNWGRQVAIAHSIFVCFYISNADISVSFCCATLSSNSTSLSIRTWICLMFCFHYSHLQCSSVMFDRTRIHHLLAWHAYMSPLSVCGRRYFVHVHVEETLWKDLKAWWS